jgi:protease-4
MFKLFRTKLSKAEQHTNPNNANVDIAKSFDTTTSFYLYLRSRLVIWRIAALTLFVTLCTILWLSSTTKSTIRDSSGPYIARVVIDFPIETDSYRHKVLTDLASDKNLAGLIVEINSPGGTITGSEILYDDIRAIASKKPSASIIYDVGASGAYMVALATDYIVCKNTSIVGSIGVVLRSFDATELASKVGIKSRTFASSEFKSSPDPISPMSEEVKQYIDTLITDGQAFFASIVKERRKLSDEELISVANGKIFNGQGALKLKLVDKIGFESDTITFIQSKGVKKNVKIIDISLTEVDDVSLMDIILDKLIGGKSVSSSSVKLMATM